MGGDWRAGLWNLRSPWTKSPVLSLSILSSLIYYLNFRSSVSQLKMGIAWVLNNGLCCVTDHHKVWCLKQNWLSVAYDSADGDELASMLRLLSRVLKGLSLSQGPQYSPLCLNFIFLKRSVYKINSISTHTKIQLENWPKSMYLLPLFKTKVRPFLVVPREFSVVWSLESLLWPRFDPMSRN